MTKKPEVKHCFVIGPIGSEGSETRIAADWLLNGIVKPVMDNFAFLVRRADEIPEPGMIDSQVIKSVHDADLVVADLSKHNANAFYELAIRHMVEKPVIHMIDKDTEIPFDVRPFRAIQFSTRSFGEVELAKAELKKQVSECIKTEHVVDNPITRARGKMELIQSATPRDKVLLETLESIAERVDQLERGPTRAVPHRVLRSNAGRYIGVEDVLKSMKLEITVYGGKDAEEKIREVMKVIESAGLGRQVYSRQNDEAETVITLLLDSNTAISSISELSAMLSGISGVSVNIHS